MSCMNYISVNTVNSCLASQAFSHVSAVTGGYGLAHLCCGAAGKNVNNCSQTCRRHCAAIEADFLPPREGGLEEVAKALK